MQESSAETNPQPSAFVHRLRTKLSIPKTMNRCARPNYNNHDDNSMLPLQGHQDASRLILGGIEEGHVHSLLQPNRSNSTMQPTRTLRSSSEALRLGAALPLGMISK